MLRIILVIVRGDLDLAHKWPSRLYTAAPERMMGAGFDPTNVEARKPNTAKTGWPGVGQDVIWIERRYIDIDDHLDGMID